MWPARSGTRQRILTGPVLGNNFDVNFGFSGMDKLASQLRDTRTKTGWERRFSRHVAFSGGRRRLYECLEVEYTAPGGTRPLYAQFLDHVGKPEAAGAVSRVGARLGTAGRRGAGDRLRIG